MDRWNANIVDLEKMLKNAPALAIRSVDTAENEFSKVSLKENILDTMAKTHNAAGTGEKDKYGSTTESVANMQTKGVQETLHTPVTTAEGSIKFGNLTFQAGTDQCSWFMYLAGGKISEDDILEMINLMTDRERR